jgi:hypothetical protein
MTDRPPIRTSEWWVLVDPCGDIVDLARERAAFDGLLAPDDGWSIRRVIVQAPEEER